MSFLSWFRERECKVLDHPEFGRLVYSTRQRSWENRAFSFWGYSGVQLVIDGDEIKVTSLHDADTPVVYDYKPLLTIDVWEHAYYIDYRNARPGYLEAITKIIDWDFVAANLDGEGVSRADQNG